MKALVLGLLFIISAYTMSCGPLPSENAKGTYLSASGGFWDSLAAKTSHFILIKEIPQLDKTEIIYIDGRHEAFGFGLRDYSNLMSSFYRLASDRNVSFPQLEEAKPKEYESKIEIYSSDLLIGKLNYLNTDNSSGTDIWNIYADSSQINNQIRLMKDGKNHLELNESSASADYKIIYEDDGLKLDIIKSEADYFEINYYQIGQKESDNPDSTEKARVMVYVYIPNQESFNLDKEIIKGACESGTWTTEKNLYVELISYKRFINSAKDYQGEIRKSKLTELAAEKWSKYCQ